VDFSGGLAQGMGSSKGWVIGKRLCSGRRDGYGQGEEMAYGVTNAGPLMRAFMTNASDPAGLYQGNKKSAT